jgi:hypothetical protein
MFFLSSFWYTLVPNPLWSWEWMLPSWYSHCFVDPVQSVARHWWINFTYVPETAGVLCSLCYAGLEHIHGSALAGAGIYRSMDFGLESSASPHAVGQCLRAQYREPSTTGTRRKKGLMKDKSYPPQLACTIGWYAQLRTPTHFYKKNKYASSD